MKETPELIYMAAPYTHPDLKVVEERMRVVNKMAAKVMAAGVYVFSPLTHCHPLAQLEKLPGDWAFWEGYDRLMLAKANRLLVLRLDGWKESVGVQAEIKIAGELGIPIEYVDPI